jgi:hypothetical protein
MGISLGLPLSGDLHGFASIWQDMVGYAETLPDGSPAIAITGAEAKGSPFTSWA